MSEFKREIRYNVIKLKTGLPVECVVVENDWPENPVVWQMIKDRVEGKPNIIEQQQQRIKELEAENAEIKRWNANLKTNNFKLSQESATILDHCKDLERTTQEDAQNILALIGQLRYCVGIAERGRKEKMPEDVMPEAYLLEYVKDLERIIAESREQKPACWVTNDANGFPRTIATVHASTVKDIEGIGYILTPLYTSPVIPDGMQLVPIEPTEAEIDAPRGFFLGLELGHKNLEAMRSHMDSCGYDYSMWPDWAKTETGHITKAGKASIVRAMMLNAAKEKP